MDINFSFSFSFGYGYGYGYGIDISFSFDSGSGFSFDFNSGIDISFSFNPGSGITNSTCFSSDGDRSMMSNIVLVGFENVGKSSLFNQLTRSARSEEQNFRGSTVWCRRQIIPELAQEITDTPGIRYQRDSAATELALEALHSSDSVVLVLRATEALSQWRMLTEMLSLSARPLAVVLTFVDKVESGVESLLAWFTQHTGVPVMAVNARHHDEEQRQQMLTLLTRPGQLAESTLVQLMDDAAAKLTASASGQRIPCVEVQIATPAADCFSRPLLGPLAAFAALALLFALPVWLAWHLSDLTQGAADRWLIPPLQQLSGHLPAFWQTLLTGSYGLLTLGLYSFIWAFPVVVLIGLSLAVSADSGIKVRIVGALDPLLRRIGLSGQDLIPVLSGFGCNVVAVLQSRACSHCTRGACVSMIAFGSACSYQLGATLSVFNAAGYPWLFAPYLLLLMVIAALHTRLWHGAVSRPDSQALAEQVWLQWPRWRSVRWSVNNMMTQFLRQAMPLFLAICLAASLLDMSGFTRWLTLYTAPWLQTLGLPPTVMPGIIFSLLRKDGLMVLNQDGGALLASLSAGQTLLLVWLASTLTACLVTLYTLSREMGLRFALALLAKQALSALAGALLIALSLN